MLKKFIIQVRYSFGVVSNIITFIHEFLMAYPGNIASSRLHVIFNTKMYNEVL